MPDFSCRRNNKAAREILLCSVSEKVAGFDQALLVFHAISELLVWWGDGKTVYGETKRWSLKLKAACESETFNWAFL